MQYILVGLLVIYGPSERFWSFLRSMAQLFSTNTFSPNTFCHNILSTSTAIYSQSAENRDKFFINFYQRVQISGKYRRNYQDQTNSLWVIRHQVLGQNVLGLNVLGLNSCAVLHQADRLGVYVWRVEARNVFDYFSHLNFFSYTIADLLLHHLSNESMV